MTCRNWCFTINNPETCPLNIPDLAEQHISVLLYQLESGLQHTDHIQGYVEFTQPVRMSHLKKLFPTGHFEKRRGTRLQAVEYVTKEDTRKEGPFIQHHAGLSVEGYLETVKTGGGGKPLDVIKGLLDDGCGEEQIADEQFATWVRHYKAFREYKLLKTKPRSNFLKLVVVVGPTGTGKSKFAMDQYPGAYWKQRSNWWDGYAGQQVVVLDEYYGWLPFDLLLRLCDRYPLLLELKGGQVQCVATTVVITSNLSPADWYQKGYKPALYRRISTILYMPELGKTQHFKNMNEFVKANVLL